VKPIVITGAMRVVTNSDYDGRANITNAIKQVSNPESLMFGYGVSINFAGKIHSPVHVHKEHSFAIDPFSSGTYGVVGMMHTNRIDWLNNPKKSSIIPLPDSLDKLVSVPIVYAFPGATKDCLDGYISTFKAIVVVAYGR
jgi:L-asparaginase